MLTTGRYLPAEAMPAYRVARPGLYILTVGAGALGGAILFGTLHAWLNGLPEPDVSMSGSIAGAIVAVEIFKRRLGVTAPTGIVFAGPFAVLVAVGRIGCFLDGLDDFTYGTPTTLPWGVDLGDGIRRHPVQLYESIAMAAMLALLLWRMAQQDLFWLRAGFYITVGWYGLQRFAWEFLRPHVPVLGPFGLFHLVCFGLVLYALVRVRQRSFP
ncbi:MAG: prolipoprotein diacylglyceryl transferase [Alphaproteobacteria bacterium]|nr:prolipoprotein diacylglyceryl transferase [Alphaproteobacteria bacterium]